MGQRILTHDTKPCSGRQELETYWSVDDVVEQHRVLDEIDSARVRMRSRAKERRDG